MVNYMKFFYVILLAASLTLRGMEEDNSSIYINSDSLLDLALDPYKEKIAKEDIESGEISGQNFWNECYNFNKAPLSKEVYYYLKENHRKSLLIVSKNLFFNASFVADRIHITDQIIDAFTIFKTKADNFFIVIPKQKIEEYLAIIDIDQLVEVCFDKVLQEAHLFMNYKNNEENDDEIKNINNAEIYDIFKAAKDHQHIRLPVFMNGHGRYNTKEKIGYIAGLPINQYSALIQFFNDKNVIMKPSILIYRSCSTGGQNLLTPYCDINNEPLVFDYDIVSCNSRDTYCKSHHELFTYNKILELLSSSDDIYFENLVSISNNFSTKPTKTLCIRRSGEESFTLYLQMGEEYQDISQTQFVESIASDSTVEILHGLRNLYFVNTFNFKNNCHSGFLGSLFNVIFNIYSKKHDLTIFAEKFIINLDKQISDFEFEQTMKTLFNEEDYKKFVNIQISGEKQIRLENVLLSLKNNNEFFMLFNPMSYEPGKRIVQKSKKSAPRFEPGKFIPSDIYILKQLIVDNESKKIDKNDYFESLIKTIKESIEKEHGFLVDYSCDKKTDLEKEILQLINENKTKSNEDLLHAIYDRAKNHHKK